MRTLKSIVVILTALSILAAGVILPDLLINRKLEGQIKAKNYIESEDMHRYGEEFFESKEQLFLMVAAGWEEKILACGTRALEESCGGSNKSRAAAFVYAVFEAIHQLGIARFLREDLPYLNEFAPQLLTREHCMDSADGIFDQLRHAQITFTVPDETVLSVIRLLYLSILHIGDLGSAFFPALRELVVSACDRLVA